MYICHFVKLHVCLLVEVEKLQNLVIEKDEDLTQLLLEKEEHEKSEYLHVHRGESLNFFY